MLLSIFCFKKEKKKIDIDTQHVYFTSYKSKDGGWMHEAYNRIVEDSKIICDWDEWTAIRSKIVNAPISNDRCIELLNTASQLQRRMECHLQQFRDDFIVMTQQIENIHDQINLKEEHYGSKTTQR